MQQAIRIRPDDTHNQTLVGQVHPSDWINPEPAASYNLVVIGAGTAGLVTAAGAAGLGAKVALVEREFMGGDCLNVGCVPSKALIRAARAYADVRDAQQYGIRVPDGAQVDFSAIMERMRRLRSQMSSKDSASRFRSLGVDVFLGEGRFLDGDTVSVGDKKLHFRRAVITTGARAIAFPIPGLADAGYLTNETVFSLTELPKRLAVIGAGPIGCELAQAFARFGSQVSLLEVAPQILIREDPDAADRVHQALIRDKVNTVVSCNITSISTRGNEKVITFTQNGTSTCVSEVRVDTILIGVGRAPSVKALNLETVGVTYDDRTGVHVNERLQTANPRIYAAGDVASVYKFTHMADALARIVIQNTLFKGRAKASTLTVPWCTYTDPEIAHVGLYEHEAKQKGIELQTFTQEMSDVDRALLDGEPHGFVKVYTQAGSEKILGATIVARHAGEMISELTVAMVGGLGMETLGKTIHPYPTQAEAIKKTADAYKMTRLTPRVRSIFEKWLAWTR